MQSPTRVTQNTSTLIDHILTNTFEKTAQCGIINIVLSNHQMIFCTRKTKKKGHKKTYLGHSTNTPLMIMKRHRVELCFLTTKDIK